LNAGLAWNPVLQALGMGAFLGVANASDQPPKFIHLKYCPPDGVVYKRVAIVGKGRVVIQSVAENCVRFDKD
jgi:leucyl aminopeptidase